MKNLLLKPNELAKLSSLIGQVVKYIVWDINALYVVQNRETLKIECIDEKPEAPTPDQYDEVFHLQLTRSDSDNAFDAVAKADMWYHIFGRGERIHEIDIVRTAVLFPSERVV